MSEYIASEPSNSGTVIQSDGRRRAGWGWLFTVFWNGLVFSIIYFQWPELLKFLQTEPIFWFFTSFPVIGIFLLYNSINDTIQWFRFGEAPLTLNQYPVYIGGNISGYIDINVDFDPTSKAEVSLRCTHHYIDQSRNGESESRADVLWQDDMLIPCQQQNGKTRVLFSFAIEDELPQTQGKGSERHEWNVVVKLPVFGKDLTRSYVVSVDKYYLVKAQGGVQCSAQPQTMRSASVLNKNATSKRAVDFSNKDIPEITTTRTGKRYYYPASRHRILGISLLVMSLFIGAMAYGMWQGFSNFLPTTSLFFIFPLVLLALLVFIFGVVVLFHSLDVVVGRSGVSVHHKILFYRYKGVLKPEEIADIRLSRNGSSSNGHDSKVWYQLKIVDVEGLETTLADSLVGHSFAKHIRQEIIDGLGPNWEPKEVVEKPGRIERIKQLRDSPYVSWLQKMIPLGFVLAIAYDLLGWFE